MLSFFDTNDFMILTRLSRSMRWHFNQQELNKLIRIGNLNEELRVKFWISKAPYFNYEEEIWQKLKIHDFQTYKHLIDHIKQENIIPPMVEDQIERDLRRTHTSEKVMSEDG